MKISPTFLAVLRAYFGHLKSFNIEAAPEVPDEQCSFCPSGRTSVVIHPAPRERNHFARKRPLLSCRDCAPGLMASVRNERADEMKPITVQVRP